LTGDIVWINGPFPAGDWNDITIFRQALINFLEEWEVAEADAGYLGEDPGNTNTPTGIRYMERKVVKKARGCVRHRQEAVNERVKQFAVLGECFKHDLSLHGNCFRACAVLTQLAFNHGKGLWSVEDAWRNRDVAEPGSADDQVPLPGDGDGTVAAAAAAPNAEDSVMEDDG